MADLMRLELLDVGPALRAERAALIRLLDALSADEWLLPTECPSWSVKGIAVHLVCDDLSLLSRQRDRAVNSLDLRAKHHPELGFVGLLNGFNDAWVELAEFFSTTVTVDLLRVTDDWTAAFYEADPWLLCEPMHWGEPEVAPVWRLAAREFTERFIHHLQIASAVGKPEPLNRELVVPAVEATLHAVRHWSAFALPPGTSVAVFLTDAEAAWTLSAEEDGMALLNGPLAAPTVTASFTAATAGDLLTRRLAASEIDETVSIRGDDPAVAPVTELFRGFAARP